MASLLRFMMYMLLAGMAAVLAAPAALNSSLTSRDNCLCAFPTDQGLYAVTPEYSNAGWAMNSDQQCSCGSWCPYACPAGFLPGQWNPDPTASRMDGGYHCSDTGKLLLPRPQESLCVDARGEVSVRWKGSASSYLCETVFPGNEDMLIPTEVPSGSSVQLAIPGQRAFHLANEVDAAGAHYYVNQPGLSEEQACGWGSNANPYGNWAPYTVGATHSTTGTIYVTVGWNPVYLESATPFRGQVPSFGVRLECRGNGCTNTECAIDPRMDGINGMTGGEAHADDYTQGPGQTSCTSSVTAGGGVDVVLFRV